MNSPKYMMVSSPELVPNYTRKFTYVVTALVWAGTMLGYYCYWVSYTSPE